MKGYLLRHAQVFTASLGQMARAPGSTLMNVCAIGITLALPTLLHLLVDNVESVTRDWQGRAQVSVFLVKDTPTEAARTLERTLAARPEIEKSELITAEQALHDFKAQSGLGAALEILDENPLPASIVLHVGTGYDDPAAIERLVGEIEVRPEVDLAQWDMAWVQRLHVILRLLERAVAVLAVLLVLAVVIIITNTIRLAILNHRDEIEIMKLIGATEGFVRRPFLYSGAMQGLLGALCATGIVTACLALLAGPVAELVSLYHGGFRGTGMSAKLVLTLLVAGSALGWLAARVAAGRYLRQIEPA